MHQRTRNDFTTAVNVLCTTIIITAAAIVLFFMAKIFIADRFTVKGHSMDPTLEEGQHIYVNKLIIGARIYTDFNFDTPELSCFRMPGFRQLRSGDIAVFNYPLGWEKEKIGFKINYVYSKRCVACPGDSLWIENGYFRNNNCSDVGSPIKMQQLLSAISEEEDIADRRIQMEAFSYAPAIQWTIKDFGPLYLPRKGDRIMMDDKNRSVYRRIIEYENGYLPEIGDIYEFKKDYCFFAGDNLLNSLDSRYLGPVPLEFVIGVTMSLWKD